MQDDDDPRRNVQCDWPGCPARGDPWVDDGWCWWPRYYLWLPEGFFCPEHDAFIKEGNRTGYFKDWPRDMSPEVLKYLEAAAQFVPLDSDDGRRIVRNIGVEARRASFHVVSEDEGS